MFWNMRACHVALPNDQRFIDPWTGKPYLLIRPDEGLIIRSVGSNGHDDGGPVLDSERTDDVDFSHGIFQTAP